MAWEEAAFCGQNVTYGDKPMDEISLALRKTSVDYMERYGRKPTVAEILAVFNVVLVANSYDYVSDPDSLRRAHISIT